jgi:hypothetical protein
LLAASCIGADDRRVSLMPRHAAATDRAVRGNLGGSLLGIS